MKNERYHQPKKRPIRLLLNIFTWIAGLKLDIYGYALTFDPYGETDSFSGRKRAAKRLTVMAILMYF